MLFGLRHIAKSVLFFFKKGIILYYPIEWTNKHSNIERFYSELIDVLIENGKVFKILPQFNKPKFLIKSPFHITFSYHTKIQASNHYNIKVSHLPNLFTIDKCGFSGWASPIDIKDIQNVDVHDANKFVKELRNNIVSSGITKYNQPTKETFNYHDYVFFPLQLIDDEVHKLSRFGIDDIFRVLLDLAKHNKIIIKRHPICTSHKMDYLLNKVKKDSNILISNSNIHSLILNSKFVLTINSGVGFESLILGKPVITLGQSDYQIVTTQIYELNELKLLKLEQIDTSLVNKFLYFYFQHQTFSIGESKTRLKLFIESL